MFNRNTILILITIGIQNVEIEDHVMKIIDFSSKSCPLFRFQKYFVKFETHFFLLSTKLNVTFSSLHKIKSSHVSIVKLGGTKPDFYMRQLLSAVPGWECIDPYPEG